MSAQEVIRAAARQLEAGDASGAYDTIAGGLAHPAAVEPGALPAALEVLARATAEIFGSEWGAALAPAAATCDAGALGAAGAFLAGQGFAALAVTVLGHAARLAPADGALLCGLAAAHQQLGDHAGAVRVIDAADAAARTGFRASYLRAFNAVMSFDPARARGLAGALHRAAGPEEEQLESRRIDGMLARFDALAAAGFAAARDDLQLWHLVRTGGLLLDVESEDRWRDGRKARAADTVAACSAAIARVHRLLCKLGLGPATVLTAPAGSSEVLGRATALLLGLPRAPWPEHAGSPGLIVVYDLERLPDAAAGALANHQPGQLLWSHAVRWTIDHPVAPDLVTFVHQHVAPPWAGELDGEALGADAAARWANEIASAPATGLERSDDRLAALAEATRGCGEHAAGVFRSHGPRQQQCAIPTQTAPF